MADAQVGNIHNVTDRSASPASVQGSQDRYFDTDLHDIAAMRARLAVIDAGYYTASRLNSMTKNDMVFAIRTADNPETL